MQQIVFFFKSSSLSPYFLSRLTTQWLIELGTLASLLPAATASLILDRKFTAPPFKNPAVLHRALLLHLPSDTHSPSLVHPPVKLALAPSLRRTRTDHHMRLCAFMPHALTCYPAVRVAGLSSASSSTFHFYLLNILISFHVIGSLAT